MSDPASSARGVHTLLIGVAGVLLAFAFSPNDADRYARAKAELKVVSEIPFSEFPEFVGIEEVLNWSRDELVGRLKEAQLPYNIFPELDYKPPLYIYGLPDESATLSEIRRFFMRHTVITLVCSSTNERSALEAALASRKFTCRSGIYRSPCSEIPSGSTLYDIRITAPGQVQPKYSAGKKLLEYWSEMPKDRKGLMVFKFGRADRDPMEATAPIELGGAIVGRPNEKTALSWLQTLPRPHFTQLLGNDATPLLFPALSEVWNEISHQTPADAAILIESKLNAARRSVSVLGMSIDERAVAVTGSCTLLALSIYLLSHLRNVNALMARSGTRDIGLTTWPCLGSDWLSRLVTFVSVLLLPLATAVSLISRLGSWSDSRTLLTAIATVGICVSGASTLKCLRTIRLRLSS